MAIPHRLPGKLLDALGPDAEGFVNWMESVDSSLRDVSTRFLRLEASHGELRQAMRADLAEFRLEMRSDIAGFREEMRADIAQLRIELRDASHGVAAKVGQTKADLMMWSFVFWVGAVAAIAALAGVLR